MAVLFLIKTTRISAWHSRLIIIHYKPRKAPSPQPWQLLGDSPAFLFIFKYFSFFLQGVLTFQLLPI